MISKDNPKLVRKETQQYGKAVFATEDIEKDEVIAYWDGPVYEVQNNSDLPNDPPLFVADHAIQFEKHKWRDSDGLARYLNHSCEPNCGIKGLFTIVAMRKINKGEEVTWDYEMTEDSDWEMVCKCGSPHCRKLIRAYRFMPPEIKEKYKDYTSDWLKPKC